MTKIVQAENSVLREMSQEIPATEIGSEKFTKIVTSMNSALDACDDGVAIAAPQIGVPWRLFIVSSKIGPRRKKMAANKIYINPVIKKSSAKKVVMEEGCLSVRYKYGNTRRSQKVLIEATNEKGNRFAEEGQGLLAQIFQHEIDHLNGVLFTDKATNVIEIAPEKLKDGYSI